MRRMCYRLSRAREATSSIRSTFMRSSILVLAIIVALVAGWHATSGLYAQSDDAEALVATALARVAPDLPIEHVEIERIVGDYAVVRIYPRPGLTDPAAVILRRTDGTWQVVAGPGTAFPDVAGLPDGLFDATNPYIDDDARANLARLAVRRGTFDRDTVGFQYPELDMIERDETATNAVRVVGPRLTQPPFIGPAYEFDVAPIGLIPDRPLDRWGFDRMREEIAQREATNGVGGPNTQPLGARYFHTETSAVFQIDWFAGDSTIREFFVVAVGGGPVIQVTARVYPVQNNPAAPAAETALTLLLQTLRAGPAAQPTGDTEGTGDYAAFAGAWARTGVGLVIDARGEARVGWRRNDGATMTQEGTATVTLQRLSERTVMGVVLASSDERFLPVGMAVSLSLLPDGMLLFARGGATDLLCGADFLMAPESLRNAYPCGYWR